MLSPPPTNKPVWILPNCQLSVTQQTLSRMNQLHKVLESLDKDITDDLHLLYDSVSQIPGASDVIDNIKMRLSSGITEIKAVIENRKAMSQETKVQLIFNTNILSEEDKSKTQELIKIGKDLMKTKLNT